MRASADNQPSIADLRIEYDQPALRRDELNEDPLIQFKQWIEAAIAAGMIEPQAMTLATATKEGIPSARTVLLREYSPSGFVFYTNYESRKGQELAENPRAALTFYWAPLHRQVRIDGAVSRVSTEESSRYFQSRPKGSQLGAWASKQSRVLNDRAELEADFREVEAKFRAKAVPCPPYWGGFRLLPKVIEFWQGRPSRLHDRFRYTLQEDNNWLIERLSP